MHTPARNPAIREVTLFILITSLADQASSIVAAHLSQFEKCSCPESRLGVRVERALMPAADLDVGCLQYRACSTVEERRFSSLP
jgi:hypothetical protein